MISARDIEKVTFSKPPIGKRGYNEDEVDAFLDLIQDDLIQIEDELEDLRNRDSRQLMAPDPEPSTTVLPPAPPPPAPVAEPPTAAASRILELAERTAAEVTEEAQREADRVTREAKDKAAETLAEARYEASKLVDSARAEATAAESRLAELRVFEENYRGRLETYMESQLFALRADAKIESTA